MSLPEVSTQPRKWWILGSVAIGTFMATLDGSIVNVALPTISSEFKVHLDEIQWVVSSYLLTISSLLLIFGRFADIIGRKKVYGTGFLVFVLGSALCGFASTLELLVASRVVQAAGAAMMMANGMGIVTSVFPPQQRGQALGIMGTVVSAGSLAGPSIGGFLVAKFGWSSIFLVNLPIGLLGFGAAQLFLPRDPAKETREPFDWAGALLFAGGLISLLWGLSNGQDYGWSAPPIIGSLALAVAALGIFFRLELKTPHPMLDLSLFKNRVFLAGNTAGLISFVAMFSTTILVPFYLQRILHFTPDKVGLLMTPFPVVMAVVAPLSGWLSDKVSHVLLTSGGLVVNAAGLVWLSRLGPETGFVEVALHLGVLGLGMGLFQSPNNSSVMGVVPPPKLGIAGGVNALVRNVGMVTGIAFSVSLFTNRLTALGGVSEPVTRQHVDAFLSSMSTVFLAAAALSLLGAFISAIRGKKEELSHGNIVDKKMTP